MIAAPVITFSFPEADRARFNEQLARYNTALGKTPPEAVKIGMITLTKSIQVSTKQAPRNRKVRASSTARRKRVNGLRLFVAEGLDRQTGAPKNIPIFAPDLATAKLHPRARIKHWGLARASWGWALKRLYGTQTTIRNGLSVPASAVIASKMFDPTTNFAEAVIDNRLEYISKALAGGRGPAVSTAMARAAGAMKGRIDQAVKRATQEAGF